jgi:hypothetical protein
VVFLDANPVIYHIEQPPTWGGIMLDRGARKKWVVGALGVARG